ncbi:MAG: hypothetical protein P8185_01540 [Deltaproteobacteria bacterium]|jgi:transketolase
MSRVVIAARPRQAWRKLVLILLDSGSEMYMALEARSKLAGKGIAVRVFGMPGGGNLKNAPLSA